MHPAGPLTRVIHGMPGPIEESRVSELSMALGAAGAPHRIDHNGKTYTFGLLTQERQNAVEKRLYQQAREAVYTDREHLTSDEYTAELRRVRESYEAGEYSFFGARAAKLLQTPKGVLMLLEVITGEAESGLVPLVTERGAEVNSVLKTVLRESLGHVPEPAANA